MGGCSSRSLLGRDWIAQLPASAPTKAELLESSPDPKVLTVEALLGRSQLNQEDLLEAEHMMNECIPRFPTHSRAYLVRGRVYFASQQWQKAVGDLTTAIKLQPNFVQAFYVRSQAYIKMSMLENAIQDYKRALLVDPENSQLTMLKAEIAKAHAAAASPDGDASGGAHNASEPCPATPVVARAGADARKSMESSKAALPALRVTAGESDSEDPFAAVATPQDVASSTAKLCMVCMDAARNCRLRPCMHAALCTECAQGLMSRNYGCPICDSCIDSLERGQFMCTFTAESSSQAALAKSIKEAAALRRLAAYSADSQASSPVVSPSALRHATRIPGSSSSSLPPFGLTPSPTTPSVLSSIFSPSSSHYTPNSRPNTTLLPPVAEVQETPFLVRSSSWRPQHANPPSPLGQLQLTPHSFVQHLAPPSPRLVLTPPPPSQQLQPQPQAGPPQQQQQQPQQGGSHHHHQQQQQQERRVQETPLPHSEQVGQQTVLQLNGLSTVTSPLAGPHEQQGQQQPQPHSHPVPGQQPQPHLHPVPGQQLQQELQGGQQQAQQEQGQGQQEEQGLQQQAQQDQEQQGEQHQVLEQEAGLPQGHASMGSRGSATARPPLHSNRPPSSRSSSSSSGGGGVGGSRDASRDASAASAAPVQERGSRSSSRGSTGGGEARAAGAALVQERVGRSSSRGSAGGGEARAAGAAPVQERGGRSSSRGRAGGEMTSAAATSSQGLRPGNHASDDRVVASRQSSWRHVGQESRGRTGRLEQHSRGGETAGAGHREATKEVPVAAGQAEVAHAEAEQAAAAQVEAE